MRAGWEPSRAGWVVWSESLDTTVYSVFLKKVERWYIVHALVSL